MQMLPRTSLEANRDSRSAISALCFSTSSLHRFNAASLRSAAATLSSRASCTAVIICRMSPKSPEG